MGKNINTQLSEKNKTLIKVDFLNVVKRIV